MKEGVQQDIVIKFAGDSGDGMQLTGNRFTSNTALVGNDLATFPDYPAEIRAPQGTLAGVSGFQLHFSSEKIFTPGDDFDVLVAMNAAALKANIKGISKDGLIIADTGGFDSKNLRLAGYETNPLEDGTVDGFKIYEIDITKMNREALIDSNLGKKDQDRSKNMFVLGFLLWMFNRKIDDTITFVESKFRKKPEVLEANIKVLKAGYHFGETTETFTSRFEVKPAKLKAGTYRSIMGNEATVYGILAASQKSGRPIFLGSYPITPASDILHELSKHKNLGVRTFQAEDEIAGVCAAIGASFGGGLGVTSTSGPGMALKAEAIGLAVSMEMPLLVCNIQRAGPSTGMPTKTEQADLLQAMYGRNGECPLPIVASKSPTDCFEAVYEAARIALEYMTPVIFLSDGYIANGAEPWKFPQLADLNNIKVKFANPEDFKEGYQPYIRDENFVRQWAIPGMANMEHRIGGLEKEEGSGNVSYDPDNHQLMMEIRDAKIQKIADSIEPAITDNKATSGKTLILGWGSTYGVITSAIKTLREEGVEDISHYHVRHIHPFPHGLKELLENFETVILPEINKGQLANILKATYLKDIKSITKVKGLPYTTPELVNAIKIQLG